MISSSNQDSSNYLFPSIIGMKNSGYIIQKMDDRVWLPIEATIIELLEGQYRMVYRNPDHPNETVNVRVVHYYTENGASQQHVLQRQGQTNPEGVVPVIPFVHLKPGVWEFECSCIVSDQLPFPNWQYQVRIEILTQKTEPEAFWDFPEDAITTVSSKPEPSFPSVIPAREPQSHSKPSHDPGVSKNIPGITHISTHPQTKAQSPTTPTTASASCPLKTTPFNPLILEDGNLGFSLDTPPPSVIQSFRALNSDQRFIAHLKKLANLGEDTSVINDIEIKP